MTREEFIEQKCQYCGSQRCYGEEYCDEYQRKVLKKMEYTHPDAIVVKKINIVNSDEEFNDKVLIRTLRYQLEQKDKQLEQAEAETAKKIFDELDDYVDDNNVLDIPFSHYKKMKQRYKVEVDQ